MPTMTWDCKFSDLTVCSLYIESKFSDLLLDYSPSSTKPLPLRISFSSTISLHALSLFKLTNSLPYLAEADQKLMMAIIATHAIQIDFVAVAERLGNVCTPRAVQERLKKIKKAGAGASEVNSTPATPGKGGKLIKTSLLTPHADHNVGPKRKTKSKPERQNGKRTKRIKVEESEASTDMLTDIGSDLDDIADIKDEEEAEVDAPGTPGGKTKAGKPKPKPKVQTKDKVKPESKAKKAASGATKSKKTNNANGNASPVKASKGTKRKRDDEHEDEHENEDEAEDEAEDEDVKAEEEEN